MLNTIRFLFLFLLIALNPQAWAMDTSLHAPATLRFEHDQLHDDLKACSKLGGDVGRSAKKLQLLLRPHLYKEEKFVLPQLGVLKDIVECKRKIETAEVVKLSRKLENEMPLILAEHKAVVKTLNELAEAGRRENKPQVEFFVKRLRMHAKYEEEVFYPSALLAAKYLLLKER